MQVLVMANTTTPDGMAKRITEYAQFLSYGGMSSACAAGLRPVRRAARRKNFGFTDRTGETRKSIGPVRRYKKSTALRNRGGGAYFRGGGIVGAVLEYRFERRYAYLGPAYSRARSPAYQAFVRQAEKELVKAANQARNLNFG